MSRRFPNRRHVNIDLGPERIRRRNLNRVSISIAGIFVLLLVASPFLPGLISDGPLDDGTPTATVVPIDGALPVEVVRVVDGDTLDVRSAQTELRVRLYGVDTPERGDACYREATDRLAALAGEHVQLLPDARLQDQFGRELRYVYASDGTLIDEQLVAEGYGHAWTDDGQFRSQIMAAEVQARDTDRGCLWGE
ncbi:MAG: thermonuclease family protein [Dehalococcoidia bacterium]|nr:thermonuclease family protein [Dehalococcoidia bacterium]